MNALLAALVGLVALVVVPLGVRLMRLPVAVPTAGWMTAGLLVVLALGSVGAPAVALALPWCLLCAGTAGAGLLRLRELSSDPLRALASVSASTSLAVCAIALVVDRSGHPVLGFDLTTWRLTVLHFGVAGFATSLLTGLALVATRTRAARYGVVAVPLGTALVAAGHFLGPWLELAGAGSLATGLLATSWTVLRHVVDVDDDGGQLLALAALTPPFTMALALWWALGEAAALPHLSLTQTAATHGLANAVGVGLCGVLGWTTVTKEQL
ncbi:MAG: YndJ family transporter [Mycobacteriales bacterium]